MTTTYDMSKKTIIEDFGIVDTVIKKEPSAELMAKLEKEGMEKVAAAKGGDMCCIPAEKTLTNIMQDGFDQFKKETGRGMTYSEMRDLYG